MLFQVDVDITKRFRLDISWDTIDGEPHSALRLPGMTPEEMHWQRPLNIHVAAPPLG